ncbi:MAG: efflux RND transporter periplasmic adaptor subunit [Actinobacteria bacterium]|nr:efflux RND transporter periplasmic adaptor subunit [Actinomycetota bacterium]
MNINKRKTILVIVSAITVLLISIISVSCMGGFPGSTGEVADQGIEVFEIQRGDILQIVSTTGSIDSKVQNSYTLQGSGEIISTLEKGDAFKKGDVLVKVDNSEGLLQLEKIEKNLKLSEISLKAAKLNYQKALDANHITIQLADLNTEKAEESTKSALDSLENANEKGESSSISQAESSYNQSLLNESTTYWSNLSSLQSSEAQMESTRDNVNQAGIQLELAKMDLESAKEDLDDYILYAPYDGIVISSDFEVGKQAGGSTMISLISDEFIVKVTVSENDISKISEGNKALITLDAYSDLEFTGKAIEIIPISTNDSGIISFEVLIEFETGEDIDIYYGLSANASIITRKAENVLYVPIQSVYKEDGKSYVDLLISDQVDTENLSQAVEKVEVTTGINDYLYIEITSGLKEGDIIVTSRIQ